MNATPKRKVVSLSASTTKYKLICDRHAWILQNHGYRAFREIKWSKSWKTGLSSTSVSFTIRASWVLDLNQPKLLLRRYSPRVHMPDANYISCEANLHGEHKITFPTTEHETYNWWEKEKRILFLWFQWASRNPTHLQLLLFTLKLSDR